MCLTPYTKKNPNYGLKHIGFNYLKDCDSQMIDIPCGHCAQCIASKQSAWVQRACEEAKKSHLFFATLTYDNAHLPVLLVPGEEYEIPFADIKHIQLLMKSIRNNKITDRDFKYLACSELGKNGGRPHFHILFFVEKRPYDDACAIRGLEKEFYTLCRKYWAVNKGTDKHPIYEPRFTYREKWYHGQHQTNFDLHYVDPSLTKEGYANVAYYVTKYMLKPSDRENRRQQALHLNLEEDVYEAVWNTVKSRLLVSKGLGLCSKMVTETIVVEKDHDCPEYVKYLDYLNALDDLPSDDMSFMKFIGETPVVQKRRVLVADEDVCRCLKENCVKLAGTLPYPIYVNDAGETFPLAPYYRKHGQVYGIQEAMTLYYFFDPESKAFKTYLDMTPDERLRKLRSLYVKQSKVDQHETFGVIDAPGLFD